MRSTVMRPVARSTATSMPIAT